MPIIRAISDLRNRSKQISELCGRENQPVFITKNGHGELVLMSQRYYEQLEARLELYEKLAAAEAEEAAGARGIPHHTVVTKLRERAREKTR